MDEQVYGHWRLRLQPWDGLGIVIEGLDSASRPPPRDYVNEVLLAPEHCEAFLSLIDRKGLVVCKNVAGDDHLHTEVRGRSSKGRLSQGEYYHHDGCAGPEKPRVVEIRCPYQETPRHIATAVAPFPELLSAMVLALPKLLRLEQGMQSFHARVSAGENIVGDEAHSLQGLINRTLRRRLPAESARAYFREVDLTVNAYREPWSQGESRFIANSNTGRTMQHRRAYLEPHNEGRPNGRLVKRWPDGPFDEQVCLRAVAG